MVATSTESFGSLRKNFHWQSGWEVGHAGVGMVSVHLLGGVVEGDDRGRTSCRPRSTPRHPASR